MPAQSPIEEGLRKRDEHRAYAPLGVTHYLAVCGDELCACDADVCKHGFVARDAVGLAVVQDVLLRRHRLATLGTVQLSGRTGGRCRRRDSVCLARHCRHQPSQHTCLPLRSFTHVRRQKSNKEEVDR